MAGQVDEIADGGEVVVIQIAGGPDAAGVEVGREVDEVADADLIVEIQVADEGGADEDGAAIEDRCDGETARVSGNSAGAQAGARPQSTGAVVAGIADVGTDGAEDGGVFNFQPTIVDIYRRTGIDEEIAE